MRSNGRNLGTREYPPETTADTVVARTGPQAVSEKKEVLGPKHRLVDTAEPDCVTGIGRLDIPHPTDVRGRAQLAPLHPRLQHATFPAKQLFQFARIRNDKTLSDRRG